MRTRHRILSHAWAGLIAASACLLPAYVIASECPENCITSTGFEFEFCSQAPEANIEIDIPGGCIYADSGGYNIPQGTLYSIAVAPFGGCGPRTTIEDEFTIVGLPTGNPISLVARLEVSIRTGCILGPGSLAAGIADEVLNSVEVGWDSFDLIVNEEGTKDTVLTLPIDGTTGTPFRVQFFVETRMGECVGWIYGIFSFDGLPAGAIVTSCNGYVQGPVQVESTTWGTLKAHYR